MVGNSHQIVAVESRLKASVESFTHLSILATARQNNLSRLRDMFIGMANEIKIHLRQVSTSTTEATLRTHQVMIDRPTAKGGTDRGPMGGELFLAAVGGCL